MIQNKKKKITLYYILPIINMNVTFPAVVYKVNI